MSRIPEGRMALCQPITARRAILEEVVGEGKWRGRPDAAVGLFKDGLCQVWG